MDHGWNNIVLEGNCKLVIDALNGVSSRGFHVPTIIDNCLSLCHAFNSLFFHFCFRDCNRVTHRLAKWADCRLYQEVWEDVAPV